MQFYDIGKITFMHILVFYSQKCRTFSLSHILCFGWIFHGSLSRGVGNRIPTRSKKKSVRERWICFFRGGMQHRPRRVVFRSADPRSLAAIVSRALCEFSADKERPTTPRPECIPYTGWVDFSTVFFHYKFKVACLTLNHSDVVNNGNYL